MNLVGIGLYTEKLLIASRPHIFALSYGQILLSGIPNGVPLKLLGMCALYNLIELSRHLYIL